jgi:chromosome segregation ATPase
MVDKQIRIDLTSRDDASATLDDVADAAAALEKASPEVDVTADTDAAQSDIEKVDALVDQLERRTPEIAVGADTSTAESGLADVEGQADDLARLSPEITVGAEVDDATRALDDVKTEVDTLTDADREIILKAKVDDASAALKSLRGDLDTTADKADQTARRMDDIGRSDGPRLAGNQVADLTGPFGDASGAASDFGGIFDGLSDISESVGTRIGKDMTGVVSNLGLAGLAVGAVAAGWSFFSQKAEEAKRKAEEAAEAQREINEALKEGDIAAATEKLAEAYESVFDAAEDAGVSVEQTTRYIRGAADSLPDLDRALEDNAEAIENTKKANDDYYERTGFLSQALVDQQQKLLDTRNRLNQVRDAVDGARRKNIDLNGTIADQDRRLRNVRKGLDDASDSTDKLRDSQRNAKRSTEELDQALGKLKDQLSFERTMLRFEQDFREAMRKSRGERELTSESVLSLKEDIFDVAEYARLTPAEVKALLRRIERGDIAGVLAFVQSYMDSHTVETPAGVKYIGGAADAHNAAQSDMNAQGPVVIPTTISRGPSSDPIFGPSAFALSAPVTNVTMYLPRGYRERDVIEAGRRAARRSGGLYRRVRR